MKKEDIAGPSNVGMIDHDDYDIHDSSDNDDRTEYFEEGTTHKRKWLPREEFNKIQKKSKSKKNLASMF